jgi:hypothetical protein
VTVLIVALVRVAPGRAGAATRSGAPAAPSPAAVIARSMDASRADWAAAPEFAYQERTRNDNSVKTHDVVMLFGTPYKRLVMAGGKPLSPDEQRAEQQKFEDERTRRAHETPDERARRIAEYHEKRARAHRVLNEMPDALEYRLAGARRAGARTVYVLLASPRRSFHP